MFWFDVTKKGIIKKIRFFTHVRVRNFEMAKVSEFLNVDNKYLSFADNLFNKYR